MAQRHNFYEFIRRNFGEDKSTILKNYSNTVKKLANLTARKDFLVKCRKSGNLPSHIIRNINCVYHFFENDTPISKKVDRTIRIFQQKILNLEIKETYYKLDRIINIKSRIEKQIRDTIPSVSNSDFFDRQKSFFNEHLKNRTNINDRRLLNS
jgi:hypothetical protein